MTGPALRPYQRDAIEALRGAYRSGAKAPLLVLPTGGGKTLIFSHIAAAAVARGKRVLVLAHRRELIRQAAEKLQAAGVQPGIIAPGFTTTAAPVQVASVQTLGARLRRGQALPAFDLIIVDEAHHSIAAQWGAILAALPGARILGTTATPERADGKGLGVEAGGVFDLLVQGPTIAELTAGGFLVPARVFAPATGPDLRGVATRGGDFAVGDLEHAMAGTITGDAMEHYGRLCPGLPAVTFCVSIAHAEATAAAFQAGGWRAVAVSGASPAVDRDAAIQGLGTGALQVLCTCDLISEGLDVPTIAVAILLRPTKSLGLFLQQVGRGLRPAPGKTHLVVLDHAANTARHGLPDAPRTWSLAGQTRRDTDAGEKAPPTRRCESCGHVFRPAPVCPACGAAVPIQTRELEHIEGTLQEVDARAAARIEALRHGSLRQHVRNARTRADLVQIGKARGYHRGWAWHTWRELQAERAAAATLAGGAR